MSSDHAVLYTGAFSGFDNKTTEQKIQELVDREEIRELIQRYAVLTAQGHGDLMAGLFTADGAMTVRIPGQADAEFLGRDALAYRFAATVRGKALPMIHNFLISISGDTALGMCSLEMRTADKDQSIIGSGYYEDRFRREDGRWKFSRRNVTNFHWVPLQQGWVNASGR